VSRYMLVVVPEDTQVPEAVVATLLPRGTSQVAVLAHWSVTEASGKFYGGTESFKLAVPGA
jgi:hypothetical protein